MLIYLFSYKQFRLVEQSRHRAASLKEFYHRLTDRFIVAAQYGRTSRLEKIYVLVAVTVVEVGAFGLDKCHRKRFVKSQIVLHAARYILLRFFIYTL